MADMSDLPFCLICKQKGAPLVFREMVSAEAIIRLNTKTLKMAAFDERERPVVQQIFGSGTHTMAEAARIIEERFHPDAIDINMGCPASKITSHFDGAALIKEPKRAAAIIRAVKEAVAVPVSVKTRLGWKRDDECLEFVSVIADAGVDLISIHGRTKEQGYAGKADWDRVGEARQRVPHVPLLVNGDIVDAKTAKEAMERSGADGMLIGRGMLGNPWLARQIMTCLGSDVSHLALYVSREERIATVRDHARLQVAHYGEHGLVKLRKHLPWYFKGDSFSKELRPRLVRINTLTELDEILKTVDSRQKGRQ